MKKSITVISEDINSLISDEMPRLDRFSASDLEISILRLHHIISLNRENDQNVVIRNIGEAANNFLNSWMDRAITLSPQLNIFQLALSLNVHYLLARIFGLESNRDLYISDKLIFLIESKFESNINYLFFNPGPLALLVADFALFHDRIIDRQKIIENLIFMMEFIVQRTENTFTPIQLLTLIYGFSILSFHRVPDDEHPLYSEYYILSDNLNIILSNPHSYRLNDFQEFMEIIISENNNIINSDFILHLISCYLENNDEIIDDPFFLMPIFRAVITKKINKHQSKDNNSQNNFDKDDDDDDDNKDEEDIQKLFKDTQMLEETKKICADTSTDFHQNKDSEMVDSDIEISKSNFSESYESELSIFKQSKLYPDCNTLVESIFDFEAL